MIKCWDSLTNKASKTLAAAIVDSRLDFAPLSWLAHPFQIWLAFSMSRILLLEWSHENHGSATSHLLFLICIGFYSGSPQNQLWNCYTVTFRVLQFQQPSYLAFLIPKSFSSVVSNIECIAKLSVVHSNSSSFQKCSKNSLFSCLLTLTVVENLVRPNQFNLSHVVIQRQLLPSTQPGNTILST